jgi:hypothetical protein
MLVRVLLATQILLLGCGEAGPAKTQFAGQVEINSLARDLLAGRVGMVELLQIPLSTITVVAVTPERLERSWDFRFTIGRIDGPRLVHLEEALKEAEVGKWDSGADIRWGVVFYSLVGQQRIGALYFDRFGHGFVNQIPVAFSQQSAARLKRILSEPVD